MTFNADFGRLTGPSIIYRGVALGAAGAEFADVAFPAAAAADKIDHMLQVHLFLHEKRPVDFYNRVKGRDAKEPGKDLSQSDVIEYYGVQGHRFLHRFLQPFVRKSCSGDKTENQTPVNPNGIVHESL